MSPIPGIPDAHDIEVNLGLNGFDSTVVIDGRKEEHCRRIRIEQDVDHGPAIVTMELYARSVHVSGKVGPVLEIMTDDSDAVVEHQEGDHRGIIRHLAVDRDWCTICTPKSPKLPPIA